MYNDYRIQYFLIYSIRGVVKMSDYVYQQLSQLVYDYCGLDYTKNLPSLESKIKMRLKELNQSVWGYINILKNDLKEWDILIEMLTINETYFFREDKQLFVLQNEIIPSFIGNNEPLRIWSAACSTGEEPYSIAMIVHDANSALKVEITATDINKKVLAIAQKGQYKKSSLSFRRIPEQWLKKYFCESEQQYQVKESICEMVHFEYGNLLLPIGDQEVYDVIFCRNVLIYFDEKTTQQIVEMFYSKLKKGGFLFLGHAESISTMKIGFDIYNKNGTFFYRKSE